LTGGTPTLCNPVYIGIRVILFQLHYTRLVFDYLGMTKKLMRHQLCLKSVEQIYRGMIRKPHPATIIILSFLVCVSAGSALLTLPVSNNSGYISFMNALFSATSVVCVTGLTVLDTGTHFTLFGQTVILILIQIGGLVLMTISVVFFQIPRDECFLPAAQGHAGHFFPYSPKRHLCIAYIHLYFFGAHGTARLRFADDLLEPSVPDFSGRISGDIPLGFSVLQCRIFPFCRQSCRLQGFVTVNLTVCGLIILGGIGFPVIFNLYEYLSKRRRHRVKISLQTKIATTTTGIFIFSSMVLYLILEQNNSLNGLDPAQRILGAFFQSVTARTAGFNTLDLAPPADFLIKDSDLLIILGKSDDIRRIKELK